MGRLHRHRPAARGRAGPDRPGPRAPGAPRDRPDRARVDLPARDHRAAVKVYFHTFGCKANQYDTELVRQAFADQGAVVVAEPADADLAVVNSCTVTGESEAKLRRFVRRDRKSTRLNSSHDQISYAVFCLKKKKKTK